MHPRTPELMQRIRSVESLEERLAILRNAYEGETCYALTCGPSLNVYWNRSLKDKLSGQLVMSVKQTYNLAPEIMDFHILNSWNYTVYEYSEPKPIIFLERNIKDPETPDANPDLLFNIPDPSSLERRLATTLGWEDYCFDKQLDRPWGPGVMYELAIYMWVHLGVKEVIVLGWDLGELNSKTMEHFFDGEAYWKQLLRKMAITGALRRWVDRIPRTSDCDVLNKPRIRDFEVRDIADSTKSLYFWLKEKGIDLKIVSDRSLIDPVVPRVNL